MDNEDADNNKGLIDFIERMTKTRGKLADPFDVSAVLVGAVGGFIFFDIPALHLGIPPGTGAGLGASGFLGLEQGVKGWLNVRRNRLLAREKAEKQGILAAKERELAAREREELPKKLKADAEALEKLLLEKHNSELLDMLNRNLELWRLGLIDDEQFKDELEKVITKYRETGK